jgi:acyl carrier protein
VAETASQVEVLDELKRIAERDLEVQVELSPALRLHEDLQLDSMQMIIVAVGLENRFKVKLGEEDAPALKTVGDLCALVVRRVKEQRELA